MKPSGPPSPNIRSPQYSSIRGARLTDRRITHYIRKGYYGVRLQQDLLETEKRKKPAKRTPGKPDPIDLAMENLL